ncbi:MAG TPA: DUF6789 family protein [Thermomicrobiales bacterium]|jgi:xanthosine utilization system XapX-like protein
MGLLDRLAGGQSDFDARRAAVAGAAGAGAYLAEMAVDLPLLDCPTDDLLLLGGLVTRDRRIWPLLGGVLHFTNGMALAQVYALVEHRLPGPPWARGVLFTLIENTLLWAIVPLFDRYHPAIREGKLPKMNRPVPFLQQVLRHIAYGAVLGAVYGRK